MLPRLVDIFAAINFTESATLAHKNPASPCIPELIVACLSNIVAPNILGVMTKKGVQMFLDEAIHASLSILSDGDVSDDNTTRMIQSCIGDGTVIETFGWMPPDWVIPRAEPRTEHNVLCVDEEQPLVVDDFIECLEPFISNANRSIPVFCALNNTLVTLHELTGEQVGTHPVKINYTFFRK